MELLQSLNVPIRKSGNVPPAFSIPIQKKQIKVDRPSAPTTPYKPEPTISDTDYQSILNDCYTIGVEMERHPSAYQDKGEEAIRDFFLMYLTLNYPNTTGETFNKSGKTDLLIKHDGGNLFVAECKIWGGQKKLHETIDQLLGYLTWRDSKAAILFFNKNKNLQPVLDSIEEDTIKHSCFVKDYGKEKEGWCKYEFHLKEDNSKGVKVSILCFNFPD